MKKRLLSLTLALALCLGLAVPAFAAENSAAEQTSTMLLTHSIDGHNFENSDGIDVTYSWKLNYPDTISLDERTFTEDYNGYFATRKDTVFTVTNTAPAGQNNFIRVYVYLYEKVSGNVYEHSQYPHGQYLTQSGTFISDMARPDDYGGLVELKPGESFQFKLPEVYDRGEFNHAKGEYDMIPRSDADVIYKVELMKWDMDNSQTVTDEWGNTYEEAPTYNKWAMFKVDNAAVDSYLAGSSTATPSTPSAAPSFTDVPANAYYADAVSWAVSKGIINGTSATAFSPEDNCTQAQILTFLWRAAGKPTLNLGILPTWVDEAYQEAVLWAAYTDMIDIVTFDPDKPCTRSTAVSYIWQALNCPTPTTSARFTNVSQSAAYAQAVSWAVGASVTNGTSTTTFSPNETCTRGQIVTFLHRAMG